MHSEVEAFANENGETRSVKENEDVILHEKTENAGIDGEGLLEESIHHGRSYSLDSIKIKNGVLDDFPASRVAELVKLNSLENASTESLFSAVNKILEDSIERKNGDVSQRVGSLLKLIVQEIEQRVSRHADTLRKQSNLYKSREERYQSRIRALETLSTGTSEEHKLLTAILEEKRKLAEKDVIRLIREKDHCETDLVLLKQELGLTKEKYETNCLKLENQTKDAAELETKIRDLESLLNDSSNRVKELEDFTESKYMRWRRKEHGYKQLIDCQFGSIKKLRAVSESIKKEVLKTKKIYKEEISRIGRELKGLIDAAENYHLVLAENRKLYNEVQDLKGNIRVYCRIRPFLPGQSEKQTTIEYIGENGELVVLNPSKQGKDNRRLFKFNKVFGPEATQEEVYLDTQPLIRSVLDGYNVCIFAYGQTGSGKTYTMSGPNLSSMENWGVNYRALNDLFNISQNRKRSTTYDIGVQMVEIYNEQVRDLLSSESSQKRLGIWNSSQPNGLSVPDASMYAVKSTADVVELMKIGLTNRAVGATALNERSSRSHSILTVHVRGMEFETNAVSRGCLHLIDLAGSERVDRSEATGDRLREAQHINKSLSALGDVIFSLAQKSSHVPYRNSKLTQVLQSSLGGQAKTIMFVQLNPDVESYSETISTLKFAERVSGVELGAARSNREGRGVRELMEQVTLLKETVARKDEEIGRLQLLKKKPDGEKYGMVSPRYGSASPRRHSLGAAQSRRLSGGKSSGPIRKAASDLDNSSEYSDKHSEAGSQQSVDELKHHKEFFLQSRLAVIQGGENMKDETELKHVVTDIAQNVDDEELLGFGDADSEERLSDISDGVLSMGTETDGSVNSIVEYTLFPESTNPPVESVEKPYMATKLPRPPQKYVHTGSSQLTASKSSTKPSSSRRLTVGSTSAVRAPNDSSKKGKRIGK